jgi:hypothetical protein
MATHRLREPEIVHHSTSSTSLAVRQPYAGSKWDIFAARIDVAGNLIDQTPIVVILQTR